MRRKLTLSVLPLFLFFITASAQGTWTPVTAVAPDSSGGGMLLLTDGTIICKSTNGGTGGIGNGWMKLTPDTTGSYIKGTWSLIKPMFNTRLYYSSQVLVDGRVYVAGGEYGTGLAKGETYDPLTNLWTLTPNPGQNVSDACSALMPNGKVLQALVAGSLKSNLMYDPVSNTYAPAGTCLGIHNEASWVKLPDNSILQVDRNSTASERYIPTLDQWIADGTVPVPLYDPYGLETGAALLLPDGRAFFIGSLGKTAYYTPSGNNNPGTWAAGPDVPLGKGQPDASGAMLVDGKILIAVSPAASSSNHFPKPTTFYEFDYLTNTYTLLTAPNGSASINESAYVFNMIDLPDGRAMVAEQDNKQFYVYTPAGAPLAAGKPTISQVIQTSCTNFKLTGTLFNGISEGAAYGDDWQMSTNYPIIRIKKGGRVWYCRTFNWNSTGVMRGSAPDTTSFTIPTGLPLGIYQLEVIANGNASSSVTFIPVPFLSSTLTPPAICSGKAFTYTPTSPSSGATFSWTRAAVVGISNAAITNPQFTDPNEVLINTTTTPKTVVYAYTTTANGCSYSQNVSVVVNPSPALVVTGGKIICKGSSATVSASGSGSTFVWSTGASTANITISPSVTTTYTVTATNTYGCTKADTVSILVSPCTGIDLNGSFAKGVHVFPNPASTSATIVFHSEAEGTYTLKLCDVSGRTISELTRKAVPGENTGQLNLENLAKGWYMIVLQKGEDTYRGSILKE